MIVIDDIYYLKISGFIIKIKFHNTEWIQQKRKFIKNFISHYSNFIIKNNKSTVDYTINYIWSEKTSFLRFNDTFYCESHIEISGKETVFFYQKSIIQHDFIFARILNKLLSKNYGFIIHASAVEINGEAFIFFGKSGSGKSTIIEMLKSYYHPLTDESLIIRRERNNFYCYQTPFFEKKSWIKKASTRYQINKFFLLRKANVAQICKILNKNYVLEKIIDQRRVEKEFLNKQMEIILEFINRNDFYLLSFNKNRQQLLDVIK